MSDIVERLEKRIEREIDNRVLKDARDDIKRLRFALRAILLDWVHDDENGWPDDTFVETARALATSGEDDSDDSRNATD